MPEYAIYFCLIVYDGIFFRGADSRVHKSRVPGRPGDKSLYPVLLPIAGPTQLTSPDRSNYPPPPRVRVQAQILQRRWAVIVRRFSCRPSGAKDFEVAYRFSENVCTPALISLVQFKQDRWWCNREVVWRLYYVCIAVFTLDARLLAFSCCSAGYKSVFGRSCDRPPWHRFFLVSLCL